MAADAFFISLAFTNIHAFVAAAFISPSRTQNYPESIWAMTEWPQIQEAE